MALVSLVARAIKVRPVDLHDVIFFFGAANSISVVFRGSFFVCRSRLIVLLDAPSHQKPNPLSLSLSLSLSNSLCLLFRFSIVLVVISWETAIDRFGSLQYPIGAGVAVAFAFRSDCVHGQSAVGGREIASSRPSRRRRNRQTRSAGTTPVINANHSAAPRSINKIVSVRS